MKFLAPVSSSLPMTDNPWGNLPPRNPGPGSNPPPPPKEPKDMPRHEMPRNGGSGIGNLPPFWHDWRNRFNGEGRMIAYAVGGVFLLWLASGLYRVEPEEQAIITQFGRYTGTVETQGLNYHLPWPIESAQKVNVTFERRLEIGFTGYGGGNRSDIPEESQMLTGDANIVDIDFVVQWKIADARHFVFNIREPENTIKKVAESAMREVVGQNDLQDIITDKREDIASRVRQTIQKVLDSYQSGVSISQILIQDASVPGPVLDAFEEVIRATQDAETRKNEAYKYRNQIVPRAQGEAIRLIKQAEAYKEQVVSKAQGEAKRFNNIYSVYKQSPAVTRERLYIQTMQDVLEGNQTMVVDGANGAGPLPFLNLTNLRRGKATPPQTDTLEERQ